MELFVDAVKLKRLGTDDADADEGDDVGEGSDGEEVPVDVVPEPEKCF